MTSHSNGRNEWENWRQPKLIREFLGIYFWESIATRSDS